MNRHKLAASTLLLVVSLCSTSIAQTHHHASLTIKGSEHPEQISDQRAWLMEFIAASSHPTPRSMRYEKLTLTDFRAKFDALTTKYNAGLSDGKHGTTAKDIALRQQFYEDVEQLLKITIGKVQNSTSPSDWEATTEHIRELKTRMTFTDDAQAAGAVATPTSAVYHPGGARLIRTQSTVLGAYAAAGYTTFTELYSDGSYWHQIVHLYGSSNGQWTCEWNQYSGMWEPPGCPAHHDFYTSNKIDGQGYSNYYEGTAWNPAQYMGISHEFDQPIGARDGSETAYSDATVDCSVAGTLMGAQVTLLFNYIKPGTTYEQWNNSLGNVGGRMTCGTSAVCRNSPPYIVDLYYVFAGTANYPGCAPAYKCNGLCVRTPVSAWSCTGTDPTRALCTLLLGGAPTNPKQLCDAHP